MHSKIKLAMDKPEMKKTTVFLPVNIHRLLRVYAIENGTTLANVVNTALERYFTGNEQPKSKRGAR